MIKKVIETKEVLNYLESRDILNQYKKAKEYILIGLLKNVDFKLRQPKRLQIYYFRINKQFRVYGVLDGEILKIFKIDNHQT